MYSETDKFVYDILTYNRQKSRKNEMSLYKYGIKNLEEDGMTLNINKMKIMVKMNTRKLKELLMERIGRIEEN